ncbi:hypothetical protein BDN70DRAFT_913332 [Pholiota conissans]|uniref:Microbial-type PARG catalytic domain-containing protein n=1 Tax=Pholiota conissans TaxID=109636 RepID=A0A9P6CU17_9AGAR|nr:hypothetical protein BDN70DRAFT_913332 [Pholiota conissans]
MQSKNSSRVKTTGTGRPSSKWSLKDIAASTLQNIEEGLYELDGSTYNLESAIKHTNENTSFYAADSNLSEWSTRTRDTDAPTRRGGLKIIVSECSVLVGTRRLKGDVDSVLGLEDKRVGVLNFASAKNPGGGFIRGAQAQEESIARSSTIYPSLMTETGQKFYQPHKKDPKEGYYSHAMIYSPRVLFFRADKGTWLPPIEADVLTSAAVNAGVVRRYLRQRNSVDESELDAAMKERMARVLYLFELRGVRHLVLGSFGTGVFRNRVELVAGVWKELLVGEHARFKDSFDRVVFAVLGSATFKVFEETFADVGGSWT